ncbi:MAG: hypothetical protein WDW38_001206 [Sanguina aurantia]
MNDAGALFNQFENAFSNASIDISRKITAIESLSGELRRKKIAEAEADIREADSVIKRMDMEARSVAPDKGRALQLKVKDHKANLVALKEQLKKASASASSGDAARAELGLGTDYSTSSMAQRDRLLNANQRLEQTNDRLASGKKMLAETDELGTGILQNLAAQRETLLHSRETLHAADEGISKARTILLGMSRRVMQNKFLMVGIILFLIAGICLIVYLKAAGSTTNPAPSAPYAPYAPPPKSFGL